ncbi:MAG: zf-HC2 domain-containing protein [Gemmatimonadetes bacterium]|nr:zf-HC2 domain-containing protein [Gemmatimonadota bacterium]
MLHVDDGQLNALLDGELGDEAAAAARAHLAACPSCARRFEEAKRFLAEAADLLEVLEVPAIPEALPRPSVEPEAAPEAPASAGPARRVSKTAKEVALDIDGATQKSPAIRPIFPREVERVREPGPRLIPAGVRHRFDWVQMAWAASVVLALSVGYLANEVRHARTLATDVPREEVGAGDRSTGVEAGERASPAPALTRAPGGTAGSAPAGAGPGPALAARPAGTERSGARAAKAPGVSDARGATQVAARSPGTRPGAADPGLSAVAGTGAPGAAGVARAADAAAELAPPATRTLRARPSPPAAARVAAAAPPADEPRRPEEPRGFRRITLDSAARALSGSIRLIDGMLPERVELGPGRLVPGADPGREVVRVHYADERGNRLTLDQQRVPAAADTGTATQPAVSGVGMAPGDTLITAAPGGAVRIRWLDRKNFWLSLAGRMEPDSIRRMVERVR